MDPRRSSLMVPYGGGIPIYNEYTIPTSDVLFGVHNNSSEIAASAVITEPISHHELTYSHAAGHHGYPYSAQRGVQEHHSFIHHDVNTSEHSHNAMLAAQHYNEAAVAVAGISAASRMLLETNDDSGDMLSTVGDEVDSASQQSGVVGNSSGRTQQHTLYNLVSRAATRRSSASSEDEVLAAKRQKKQYGFVGKKKRVLLEGSRASSYAPKAKRKKKTYTERAMNVFTSMHSERMDELRLSKEATERMHHEKMTTVAKLLDVLKKF